MEQNMLESPPIVNVDVFIVYVAHPISFLPPIVHPPVTLNMDVALWCFIQYHICWSILELSGTEHAHLHHDVDDQWPIVWTSIPLLSRCVFGTVLVSVLYHLVNLL